LPSQRLPQTPQLNGSFWRFTQPLPQQVRSFVQATVQTPVPPAPVVPPVPAVPAVPVPVLPPFPDPAVPVPPPLPPPQPRTTARAIAARIRTRRAGTVDTTIE